MNDLDVINRCWGEVVAKARDHLNQLFGETIWQTEANTRQALKIVDDIEPCVLSVDDIEPCVVVVNETVK